MKPDLRQSDLSNLVTVCRCGSEDVKFVACPEHAWAVAFLCFTCLQAVPVGNGRCPDCGWKGED